MQSELDNASETCYNDSWPVVGQRHKYHITETVMTNKSTFIVILVVDGIKYCLHSEGNENGRIAKSGSFLKIELESATFVPAKEELHNAKLFFNMNCASSAIDTITKTQRARNFLAPNQPYDSQEWKKRLYIVELTPAEDL